MSKVEKKTMPRWTADEVDALLMVVESADSEKAAFAQFAETSGRSASSIAQKFYGLKKAKKPTAKSEAPAAMPAKKRGRPAGSKNKKRAKRAKKVISATPASNKIIVSHVYDGPRGRITVTSEGGNHKILGHFSSVSEAQLTKIAQQMLAG